MVWARFETRHRVDRAGLWDAIEQLLNAEAGAHG
jgi:hypothetical protein